MTALAWVELEGVAGRLGLRVLCVDDEELVREALSDLLSNHGYDVVAGASLAEALTRLRERPVHLIITDYSLGDGNGLELLQTAENEGLMGDAFAFVVTANMNVQANGRVRVFRKPLDVDTFLRTIDETLAPARDRELAKARQNIERAVGLAGAGGAMRASFILYISAASPSSLKALRNMERLLLQYEPTQVTLKVCDLSKEAYAEAEEDRIAFTPTLVKRHPSPRTWILGDLEDSRIVADLLAQSGVERKK